MSAAFTPEELVTIRSQLKNAAKKYLAKYGVKKTTVDQIVAEAGISKGAFYKFYDSKEYLFFDVIEDLHMEIYNNVLKTLQDSNVPNPQTRLENVLLYHLEQWRKTALFSCLTKEYAVLARKLPKEYIENRFTKYILNIINILTQSGICISCSPEFASALVHAITYLTNIYDELGEKYYSDVMKFIVHSICVQLVPS